MEAGSTFAESSEWGFRRFASPVGSIFRECLHPAYAWTLQTRGTPSADDVAVAVPFPSYSLGSPCNYDDDCFVEHAFCQMQTTCNCKRGYRPSEDYYQCIATVGAACHSKHDCSSLPNSVCSVDTCDCDQGFVPDTNSLQCIPVAQRYQSRCNQTDQCTALLGALGHCSPANGTCLCRAGAHYHSGRCFPNVDLGLHCHNKSYCYINERMVGRLDCINHVCQCASGFSRTGNYCTRPDWYSRLKPPRAAALAGEKCGGLELWDYEIGTFRWHTRARPRKYSGRITHNPLKGIAPHGIDHQILTT
ncbi:hypothetical protein AAG570_003324 [Ranatra chinensis]|uniref:EB domain-containing protein n=1 Tax=Ranatra chinensis TaxID=642074 RepID=A0ABD0Y6I8_9HEMI